MAIVLSGCSSVHLFSTPIRGGYVTHEKLKYSVPETSIVPAKPAKVLSQLTTEIERRAFSNEAVLQLYC